MAHAKRACNNRNSLSLAFVPPNKSQPQFVHPITFDRNNDPRETPAPTSSISASHLISNPSLSFAFSPTASGTKALKPNYRITPFARANRPFDLRGLQHGDVDVRQKGIFGTRSTSSRTWGVAVEPSKRRALRSGRKGRPKRECGELGGTAGKRCKMSGEKRERGEEMDEMGEEGVPGLEGSGGGKRPKLGDYKPSTMSAETELPTSTPSNKMTIIQRRVLARLKAARKERSETMLMNNTSNQSFATQPRAAASSEAGGMMQEYNHGLPIDDGNVSSTQSQSSMQSGSISWSQTNYDNGTPGLSTIYGLDNTAFSPANFTNTASIQNQEQYGLDNTAFSPANFTNTASIQKQEQYGLDNTAFSPANFTNTASIQKQEQYQDSPIVSNLAPAPATDLGGSWLNNPVVQGPHLSPSGPPQAGAMAITQQSQGLGRGDILSPEGHGLQTGEAEKELASDERVKPEVSQWYVQGHFVGTPTPPLLYKNRELYNPAPRQVVISASQTVLRSADLPVLTPAPKTSLALGSWFDPAPTPEPSAATPLEKVHEVETNEGEAEETNTVYDRDHGDRE